MAQVLVSVRFQGYYLQLLISRDSTIRDLVNAMRQNTFIPANMPDNRLRYKKSNNQIVTLDDEVAKIIQNQENNVHYLEVEIIEEKKPPVIQKSKIQNNSPQNSNIQYPPNQGSEGGKKGNEFFQVQTNRILERIVRYLKEQNIESLLRARQNKRIQAVMAQHLTSIGQAFQKIQKQCQFYQKCLQKLVSAKSKDEVNNSIKQMCDKYNDYVKDQKRNLIRDVSELKIQLIEQSQQHQKKTSKILESSNDIKQKLERQLKVYNTQKARLNEDNRKLQSQINDWKTQYNELKKKYEKSTDKCEKKEEQVQGLKQKLQTQKKSFQKKNELQKDNLKKSQASLQEKQKQVIKLKKQLEQKITLLQQKEENIKEIQKEMKKLQQSSIESQISQFSKIYEANDSNKLSKPKQQIHNDFNYIIRNQAHNQELIELLETQTGQSIVLIRQLMKYNQNYDKFYSFHQELHDKKSLLLIIRTHENKFIGAFTNQPLKKQPQSQFMPDFSGSSLLFSLIDDEILKWSIKKGENSIQFDFECLVFGYDELMVDFTQKKCTSKFVDGQQFAAYTTEGYNNTQYQKFLSSTQEKSVDILQYMIYEVQFGNAGQKKRKQSAQTNIIESIISDSQLRQSKAAKSKNKKHNRK